MPATTRPNIMSFDTTPTIRSAPLPASAELPVHVVALPQSSRLQIAPVDDRIAVDYLAVSRTELEGMTPVLAKEQDERAAVVTGRL